VILKLLIFVAILALVYFIFFKKPKAIEDKNKKNNETADTLIECSKCGTYITKDESILSNGKHFCSQECLNK
jgi:uncharacterized protein